jgi:rhodanese-related sulfurtransferase
MAEINATELSQRLQSGAKLNLLDVREEIEFLTYNIGGINIPLSKLQSFLDAAEYNKTDELIVICTAGLRSETACNILTKNGYENARNLTGGLIALQKIERKIQ